jgi:drug/metabolite transporter (DMT)-like permease
MSWQILVAIATITYSISVVLQRVLMKDENSDPIAFSIAFQLMVGIITGIYAIIHGFRLPNLVPFLPNLFLMTLLYGLGNILIFKSLKTVDASTFTIVFASRTVWIVVGAIIFLKESFSLQQTIGTILIICSIILVSWKRNKNIFNKGIGTVLLAAIVMGAGFTNDAFIIPSFDTASYVTIVFLIPSLVLWCLYPKSTKYMKNLLQRKTFWKLLLLTSTYAISAITIFLAYQVGKNASQIAPLNQTSTILIVLLSMIFLGERSDYLKKIIGALVSFIGVLLVK